MSKRDLILDACLAITFGNRRRLDLLAGLRDRRVLIADRARVEVLRPPASEELRAHIEAGKITVEAIDLEDAAEQSALARFDAMPAFRGRGEAEVLALAATRGYLVGSDELAVRRAVAEELGPGRVAKTLDVVVWAVREKRIDLREAEAFLRECDVGPRYLRALAERGRSLEDLI